MVWRGWGGVPRNRSFPLFLQKSPRLLGRLRYRQPQGGGPRGQADGLRQCEEPAPAKLAQDALHQNPGGLSHLQGPTPGDAYSYDDPEVIATLPQQYCRNTDQQKI